MVLRWWETHLWLWTHWVTLPGAQSALRRIHFAGHCPKGGDCSSIGSARACFPMLVSRGHRRTTILLTHFRGLPFHPIWNRAKLSVSYGHHAFSCAQSSLLLVLTMNVMAHRAAAAALSWSSAFYDPVCTCVQRYRSFTTLLLPFLS
jgi:hypothetical protein